VEEEGDQSKEEEKEEKCRIRKDESRHFCLTISELRLPQAPAPSYNGDGGNVFGSQQRCKTAPLIVPQCLHRVNFSVRGILDNAHPVIKL